MFTFCHGRTPIAETKNPDRDKTPRQTEALRNGHSFESVLNSTVIMGKRPAKERSNKRTKKQQQSVGFDTDDDSGVPGRSPTVYEGERAARIARSRCLSQPSPARPQCASASRLC